MSEESKEQYNIRIQPSAAFRLDAIAAAQGFHSGPSLSATILHTVSKIPAEKLWEVLAQIERYQLPVKNRIRRL
ncbi:MAG: hypothetical protein LBK99_05205 [Opitutaceae bacterium]|jgi:hypothetical protein|nr:hypothetical protein [Opitutaceae bacterium]